MNIRMVGTKALAIAGAVLAALPLVAPVTFSALRLAGGGSFMFDYLMPMELFFLAVAGGILILAAALLGKLRRLPAALSLGAAGLLFAATSAAAELTGLAHGDNPPEGWRLHLVMGLLALFIVAEVAIMVVGILQTRDLFRKRAALTGG
jgi:hypothetical protein